MEIEEIKIESLPSANFGPGIELLMNDKRKEKPEIKIGDIESLEQDLNNLVGPPSAPASPKVDWVAPTKDWGVKSEWPKVEPKDPLTEVTKSWDGFKSINIVDPDKEQAKTVEMSTEEVLRNKFKYIRKLEDLERKGVTLTKKYTMDSNLLEMQGEYENIVAEREKLNNVKFQGKMLMACITGLEFLNSKFDPFDVKLDGWAEQLNENIEDYDDIFGELHEKYRSKAKLAPELKLLFQLGGSAIMVHMTNTMFKSAIPGMEDIMKQNPELMQQFTKAAVSSMSGSNPGFGSFMNTVVPERKETRPDMKGPSDISDILGGLKTKSIVLEDDASDTEVKRSYKRKPKSDKNTMVLNL